MSQPESGFVSIALKLQRAEEHQTTIAAITGRLTEVDCALVFKEDQEKGIGYFVIRLPEPPPELPTVVGDCLHNLRSALDYAVWQMVLSNPPNTPDQRNMFPICRSRECFRKQIKRGRLQGIPKDAVGAIESFQPYESAEHPLALLDQLYNADKHRDLNFTISVASELDVLFARDGQIVYRAVIGNDEVYDGAVFGDIGVPLTMLKLGLKLQARGRAAAFIAFKGLQSTSGGALAVFETLSGIRDFIEDEVIVKLKRFIC